MRNRYFDGIDPTMRAQQLGTASLRIDRGTGAAPSYQIRAQRAASANASYAPLATPMPTAADLNAANKAKATAVVARVLGVPTSF